MSREALQEEWRERLEDFAVSDLTVQQWCDFNRVPVCQYYYWRRRLARKTQEPAQQPVQPPEEATGQWLALPVVEAQPVCTPPPIIGTPTCTPTPITLRIAGAEIDVTSGFDAALLREVVTVLRATAC
jgi:hypothetical protein